MKTQSKVHVFTSGLIVGLFAGSITLFLSKTEEGRQFRAQMSQHWQRAREQLISQGLIDESVPSEIEELVKYLWIHLAKGVQQVHHQVVQPQQVESGKRRSSVKKKRTSKKRGKFKGV